MSAAEIVTPLTMAIGGDAGLMDGAGVGCGVATGLGVAAGFVFVVLEPGRRVCAEAKLNSRTAANTAKAILGKIIRASFLERGHLARNALNTQGSTMTRDNILKREFRQNCLRTWTCALH
jgi:hypothetical protein